jgi:hypothetical protein
MNREDRLAIWERDQRLCGICGEPVAVEHLEIDHITPRMAGGSDDPRNLRAAHGLCNRRRAGADRKYFGFVRGSPGPYAEPRLDLHLDVASQERLEMLVEQMELTRSAVVRQAIRLLAEKEGVEAKRDRARPQPPEAQP